MNMVSDNFCSTKLSLWSGSDEKTDDLMNKTSKSFDLYNHLDQLPFPSVLSLKLSLLPTIDQQLNYDHGVKDEDLGWNNSNINMRNGQASNSSFSNGNVKRERTEVCIFEDVEVDEDGRPRKKLRLTKEQSLVLEESFKDHTTLTHKEKQDLANMLNLKARQVEVWFQNRRARTKVKQTEIDSEILKKCYESLKEENKKLRKELQDLKANIFYMHLPAATTLNMCSSCQMIGGAVATATAAARENPSKISFSMGARSHFYSPNANPLYT